MRRADTQKSRRFSNYLQGLKAGSDPRERQTSRSQDAFQNYLQGLKAGSDLREEQTPRSQDAFQITCKCQEQWVLELRQILSLLKVINKDKKCLNQETHHWEPEGKSGYPVLEPHPDLLLKKSG